MDKRKVVSSLFRSLVEDIPEEGMGTETGWNWTPDVQVDANLLNQNSPTTEYSSDEDDEN